MSYEIKGKIEHIGDTEHVGKSNFAKRIVVIGDGADKYPQSIPFEVVGDRTALLDDFNVGDTVVANFDLRGREWDGRWFSNIQIWRMERVDENRREGTQEGAGVVATPADDTTPARDDLSEEDIPF